MAALLLLGVMNNAVPWTAVTCAQQALPSGADGALDGDGADEHAARVRGGRFGRLTTLRQVGLLVSLMGVTMIVVGDVDAGRLFAVSIGLGATVLYAIGTVYAKRKVSGRLRRSLSRPVRSCRPPW